MDRASTSDEDLVVDVTGFEARMDAILRGEQVGEEREEEREEGEEEWAARWDADDGELHDDIIDELVGDAGSAPCADSALM